MRKNIFIIGGRTQARSLAESLLKKKHIVTLISPDEHFCNRCAEIEGLNVVLGEGSDPAVLADADIYECDVAIAMNDHDADNLIICEICKKMFHVEKTVTIVSDVRRISFFYEMGVDKVVSAITYISNIIEEETVADEVTHIVPVTDGRIRISETQVAQNSKMVGKSLIDIRLPEEAIIGCIIRGNETIIPRGKTVIYQGDTLLLISAASCEEEALQIIKGK